MTSRNGVPFRIGRFAWPFLIYVPAHGPADEELIASMPPFVGWRSSAGLLGGGGPFPSLPVPAGRFAAYPSTELGFTHAGGSAALDLR